MRLGHGQLEHHLPFSSVALTLAFTVIVAACGGEEPLAPGLECIELASLVTSYQEVIDYYEDFDLPARLDPDRDGIPCEQDFSPREIEEFFGTTSTTPETTAPTTAGEVATTTATVDEADTTTDTAPQVTTITTIPAPVGLFASVVGGTQPRVCQRWADELDNEDEDPQPFFGLLRETPTIQVGTIAVFCLFEFDFDTPVSVEVTDPEGSTTNFSIRLSGFDEPDTSANPLAGEDLTGDGDVEGVQWVVPSTHPLGGYGFVASQGDLVLEATVEMTPTTTSRIDGFVENRGGFPDPLGFAFSGFPPGATIQLGVYEDITDPTGDDGTTTDHEFALVTTLPSVQADSQGAVIVYLEEGTFEYESGHRHCLATTLDLIPEPVCDNFRGGWFSP